MRRPRRLLLATDFSEAATSAAAWAGAVARELGAELHLLHVRLPTAEDGDRERRLRELADELGGRMVHRSGGRPTPAVVPHTVRGLDAAETIVAQTEELAADLVVLGSHGRKGLRRALLGSVAERVIRLCPLPVLTVREGAELPESGVPERILAAHDFSPSSDEALAVAAALARRLDRPLTLLHVVEPTVYPPPYALESPTVEHYEQASARARTALAGLAASRYEGLGVEAETVVGRPATAIVERAATLGGLVVLGTHGLTGLSHAIVGSVAERVARSCPRPVLTVRAATRQG